MSKGKRANLERLLASAWEKQRSYRAQTRPPMASRPESRNSPWYESGLFWGCASVPITLVPTVIVAKDLRWLLLIVWTFAAVSWWVACRNLKYQPWRWILFFLLLVGTGVGLMRLYNKLAPSQAKTPSTPVLARIGDKNLLAFSNFTTNRCRGYDLFMHGETGQEEQTDSFRFGASHHKIPASCQRL